MNIAVFMSTPAQVHFYKNIATQLERKGHALYFLARDYGETLDVLDELRFEYFVFSKPVRGAKRMLTLPVDIARAVKWLVNKRVDVITGFEIYGAYTSRLIHVPYVQFYDSEPSVQKLLLLQYKLMLPATDVLLTPSCFREYLGKKHMKVKSFKELAYLHPHYYSPKDDIFGLLGVERGEDYVLLRFNAFDAAHDLGVRGFTDQFRIKLVRWLEKYVKVFISSEAGVPKEIRDKVIKIPKGRIHDALFYAKLLVTDTQTMATEAGLLGTPALRYNKFVGIKDMGNFIELERKYGLIFNCQSPSRVVEKAAELIKTENVKEEWRKKREQLLKDKIDITSFMVWFLENYPESLTEFRRNPDIQYSFR